MMDSIRSFGTGKLIGIAAIVLVVIGIPLGIVAVKTQQNIIQHAWQTDQSVSAACSSAYTAIINVTFTNTETGRDQSMKVTAKDTQSGKSINLGTVKPGQTVTGTIDTGSTHFGSGSVIFYLSWTDNSDSDTRSADYNTITCHQPTSTPTPSATPTLAPSQTPTPTTKPSDTPTPTPCITPGKVNHVHIICPNCTLQ